jgi:hypothetical protein
MLGFIAGYLYGRRRQKYSRESLRIVIASLAVETGVPIEELLDDGRLWKMLERGHVSYDDCLNYIADVWG